MFKLIITTAFLTFYSTTGIQTTSETNYVYMCKNDITEVYHIAKDCRGLKQCKHEVKKLTLEAAEEMELRLCGWED